MSKVYVVIGGDGESYIRTEDVFGVYLSLDEAVDSMKRNYWDADDFRIVTAAIGEWGKCGDEEFFAKSEFEPPKTYPPISDLVACFRDKHREDEALVYFVGSDNDSEAGPRLQQAVLLLKENGLNYSVVDLAVRRSLVLEAMRQAVGSK